MILKWQYIITAILTAWIILNLLDKVDFLSKYNLSVESGFFLTWKTDKGKKLIENLVNKYKDFFSKLGFVNTFTSILAILVVTAILVFQLVITVEQTEVVSKLPIEEAVILPGFAIPIFYGALALGVAIIFHEFSHGIYARLDDIEISSLGVGVFAVLPLAFVEPDEEDIEESSRFTKIKMFSAGVSTNIYLAISSFIVVVLLISLLFTPASSGLGIASINQSTPAYDSGLREDMMITHMNGQEIDERGDFLEIIQNSEPGDSIIIKTKNHGTISTTLTERDGEAFLGVGPLPIKQLYNNFRSPQTYISPLTGESLTLLDSPFYESTINPSISLLFIQSGFWIALVNFWLGIINMMPIYPLDGGRVFKELVEGSVDRINLIKNKTKVSRYIVTFISVVFLLIYILPIIVLLVL
ncbi:hypothetical protein C9439_02515 [archaeon SCG-AAA382B04]|nr:hypothetical protein C9439_02515 [archaeon SCG-AAA382B04]